MTSRFTARDLGAVWTTSDELNMSTRKIKLSQKLTLRFRDKSMPDASAVADLLNEEPDQSSSAETFDSLPDLLPYIFKSQTESQDPDMTYFVSDCSTYKLWESSATDVISLASQHEDAEHWLLTGMRTREAINSESGEQNQVNLKLNEKDSVTEVTKSGVRDNLRRVQAFSPHTSILYAERDFSLDDLPGDEDVRSVHAEVGCDAVVDIGSQPDPLDVETDINEIDSYLMTPEEDVAKGPAHYKPTDADETADNSKTSGTSEASDSLETGKHPDFEKHSAFKRHTEIEKHLEVEMHPDIEVHLEIEQHSEVTKHLETEVLSELKKLSTRRNSAHHASDFPKDFTKQKRSTPKRRDQPNLVRKLNWLSDTEKDCLDDDQNIQVTPKAVETERTISNIKTKRTRKTMSVASTTLSNKPPASQPRSRRGRAKKQLRLPAGEE